MDYKFKGAFDSTVSYELGDVVNYGGNTWYLAKPTGAAGVIPGEYWNHWLPVDQDAGDVYRAIEEYGFMPTVSDPQDGDVLVYDGTAGKWKNGEGGSGGGVMVAHFTEDVEGNKTLDMKAGALYAACQQAPVFIVGYDTDMQAYKCDLIETAFYDESDGYMFNAYTAQTADDYPVYKPGD